MGNRVVFPFKTGKVSLGIGIMSASKKRKVSEEKAVKFPGEVEDVHPLPFITKPPQPKEKKPGQLSKKQLDQFFDEVSAEHI